MASMMKSKSGKAGISTGTIETWIEVFVLIIVLFKAVATLYPEGTDAGDSLNASGIPLGSFFVSGGVIWLLVAAAMLFVVIRSFLKGGK